MGLPLDGCDALCPARLKTLERHHPAIYDGRIGNPFARACKFSGKTASTRSQSVNKKGRPLRRPFEFHMRRIRGYF
jgi:hypothetical protein